MSIKDYLFLYPMINSQSHLPHFCHIPLDLAKYDTGPFIDPNPKEKYGYGYLLPLDFLPKKEMGTYELSYPA